MLLTFLTALLGALLLFLRGSLALRPFVLGLENDVQGTSFRYLPVAAFLTIDETLASEFLVDWVGLSTS